MFWSQWYKVIAFSVCLLQEGNKQIGRRAVHAGVKFQEKKKNPPGVGFQQLHTICKRAGGCVYVFGFSEVFGGITCEHCVSSYLKSKNKKKVEKTAVLFNDEPWAVFRSWAPPSGQYRSRHDAVILVIDYFCINRKKHANKVNTGWFSEQINNYSSSISGTQPAHSAATNKLPQKFF